MSRSQNYYNSVYSAAKSLGANDVQAHLAASQASLETGYGRSVKGNNHFGIKAGSKYTGKTVNFGTHEFIGGKRVNMTDRFRAYSNLRGSVKGYMEFMERTFPEAWNAPNISTAASKLKSGKYGSYATDPKYASKIRSIASRNGKNVTDLPLGDAPTPTPRPNSPTEQAQMVAASRDSMLQGGLLGFDGRQSAQTWAAPAGTVERGLLAAPVQADIAPAGTMAVALDAMPTGSVERKSIAPPVEPTFQANVAPAGSMVASLPAAPAGAVETGGLLAPATNPAIGTPGDFNSLARATPANPGLLDQPDTNPYASVGVTDEQFAEMQAGVPQPATPMPATAPVTRPQTMQPTPPIGTLPPAPVVAQPQIAPTQPQVAPAPQASGYAPAMEAQRQAQSVPSGMHAIGGLFGAPEGAMAVSRSNPGISFASLGNGYVEKTNQYGHRSILSPGDYSFPTTPGPQANYSMASATGIPSGVQAPDFDQMETGGFLGIPEARSRLGQTVRGSLGGAAGAAVGGLLGPVGAVLGGLVGRELAQGRNPMDAFSRQQTSALNTGFRPGDVDLFPAAPSMSRYRGPEGGGDYNHADWDSLSDSTRDAISNSPGGLY